MTRFVGDAKDVRDGRKKLFPTSKEMKKNMEVFKRTGKHPALDASRNSDSLPPLPERDMNRPHVFIDVNQGNENLGDPRFQMPKGIGTLHRTCAFVRCSFTSVTAVNLHVYGVCQNYYTHHRSEVDMCRMGPQAGW